MNTRKFFFFSSRRRHTRCSRDWSSDVCSSDLFFSKLVPKPLSSKSPFFRAALPRFLSSCGHLQRSEEHTSELQSRLHLVCRLLLEKKKNSHLGPRVQCGDCYHASRIVLLWPSAC